MAPDIGCVNVGSCRCGTVKSVEKPLLAGYNCTIVATLFTISNSFSYLLGLLLMLGVVYMSSVGVQSCEIIISRVITLCWILTPGC